MELNWELKSFDQLTNTELYKVMALRQEVFIIEQDCPYLDADGLDHLAMHLMGWDGAHDLLAYSRIFPAGITFSESSIGRIISSGRIRGQGIGRQLMDRSLHALKELYGNVPVRIGAQTYLTVFYRDFGFEPVGNEYLEDGIPHIEMLRQPT
jgi:ElaA protein